MRIALLTEGGYPFAHGESVAWCDRLLRGLGGHEFDVYALSRSARQENGPRCEPPDNVRLLRTAPLWDAVGERRRGRPYGRRRRRRFAECFGELAAALCAADADEADDTAGGEGGEAVGGAAGGAVDGGSGSGGGRPAEADRRAASADRFAQGLYGLAELARDHGPGLRAALRSELALRTLESACRAPGAPRAVRAARVTDLFAVSERLERALRPLSLDWYGPQGLAGADLCHAVGGGPAALPGLVTKRFFGTPLLISEYGTRGARGYGPGAGPVAPAAAGASVRALLASFQRQLTGEAYARADLITSGDSQARGRQLRRGAPEERLRTVCPGLDAGSFAEPGERAERGTGAGGAADATLVWTGRIEPEKDVLGLLHAFADVRRAVPEARLRLLTAGPERAAEAYGYEADCRALADRLFAAGRGPAGGGEDAAGGGPGSGSGDGPGGGPGGGSGGGSGAELPVSFEPLGRAESADGVSAVDGAPAADGGFPADGAPPAADGAPVAPPAAAATTATTASVAPADGVAPSPSSAPAEAPGAGCVVVFTGSAEGFPVPLAEAMFRGRATVSTDVGLVREVIGGTGLVVPPRDPEALAAACVALLRDPARRDRLGAAARERALELFTVEQNVAAFRGLYLELLSRRTGGGDAAERPSSAGLPFARPPESRLPGSRMTGRGPHEPVSRPVGEGAHPPVGDGAYETADEPVCEPRDEPVCEPADEPACETADGTAPPRVPRRRRRPLSGGRRPGRRGAGR